MREPVTKSKKEIYREQYDASKQGGEMFYPETIVRDAIVALLVVAVIIALAIIMPATIEAPADPATTTYNPRPEWYFLFLFQFLKLFPGQLEPVAAVAVPAVALVILSLVPFFDSSLERRWSRRKRMLGLGVLALAGLITLELAGALSAPSRPASQESPLVIKGQQIYNQIDCAYCHSINGVGGSIGPDLTSVGGQLDKQQLETYLQNPHAMIPTSLHPKLQFTPEELQALSAYLATLGAQVSYTSEAPVLYDKYCSACHMLNGKGGTLGPDLTNLGDRRPLTFIEAFTTDPRSVIAGTTMPAFRGTLTPEQINDIAAYLFSQKSSASANTTAP
ncbi:MAG: c-type cytochrome [Chloroflexota bacterium]